MIRGGGGYTHLANLLPELSAAAPDLDFMLLASPADWSESFNELTNLELCPIARKGMWGRYFFVLVEAGKIARKWRSDLYFSVTEYVPPSLPCSAIASFRNPNVFTELDQGWGIKQTLRLGFLRKLAMGSARRCARILFVSHDSAQWIGDGMDLPREKRFVLHHGIDPAHFSKERRKTQAHRTGVLSVSSIYRYKNFVRLIEAWHLWVQRAGEENVPDLTIVGDEQDPMYLGQMEDAIQATGSHASRIHLQGAVPYSEIADYYAGADLFVFPSYLETFGHPLVEAMATGIPIVASDIPVFREIAQESVVYANPHSSAELSRAMESAIRSDEAAANRILMAAQRVDELSWGVNAQRLAELFRKVISEGRGGVRP